jgi:phytoene/squalene synthetase
MTDWNKLLARVSPTLALSLAPLDPSLRQSITWATMAVKLAESFEESTPWPPASRRRALLSLAEFWEAPSGEGAEALKSRLHSIPVRRGADGDRGWKAQIVARLPRLVDSIASLPEAERTTIWSHGRRAAERSSAFAMRARPEGGVVVRSVEDLDAYCGARSGVVAEVITEVLILHEPRLLLVADVLRSEAAAAARGIRLVDYLDTMEQGCCSLIHVRSPLDTPSILEVSREGLGRAERYVDAMRKAGASRPVVAFAALPVAWARGRLERLRWGGPWEVDPAPTRRAIDLV